MSILENHHIRLLSPDDASSLLEYVTRNQDHFQLYEPLRGKTFYTYEHQFDWLNLIQTKDNEYHYGLFDSSGKLLGRCSLTNIVLGVFQNAYISYSIDKDMQNKGLGSLLVEEVILDAFNELQLHRIQAAVMIHNEKSKKVLEKNHFRFEGTAQRYLKINGNWEDHDLYALTKEEIFPFS